MIARLCLRRRRRKLTTLLFLFQDLNLNPNMLDKLKFWLFFRIFGKWLEPTTSRELQLAGPLKTLSPKPSNLILLLMLLLLILLLMWPAATIDAVAQDGLVVVTLDGGWLRRGRWHWGTRWRLRITCSIVVRRAHRDRRRRRDGRRVWRRNQRRWRWMRVPVVRPALEHAAVVGRGLGHRPPVRTQGSGVPSRSVVESSVLKFLKGDSTCAWLTLVWHQRRWCQVAKRGRSGRMGMFIWQHGSTSGSATTPSFHPFPAEQRVSLLVWRIFLFVVVVVVVQVNQSMTKS